MISNSNPIMFILITFGILISICVMLLPSILELKKPKDAGPRIIMESSVFTLPTITNISVLRVEEERFDPALIEKIADVIAILPDLEI